MEIILGDDATYPVKGVGNVTLQLDQGNLIHLQEVFYVHDVKKNLVSISAMKVKGYKVPLQEGHWRPCPVTHLFNGTEGLPIFIVRPYLM